MTTASIVDYGVGNLKSIANACKAAGLDARPTSLDCELRSTDLIILPGVGSFTKAVAKLKKLNLIEELQKLGREGKPIFGICLGMQLLGTTSEELGVSLKFMV